MKYELFLDVDEPRYDDPGSPDKIDLGVYNIHGKRYDLFANHRDSEPWNTSLRIRYGDEAGDIHGMEYFLAMNFVQGVSILPPGREEQMAMAECVTRFMKHLLQDIQHHTDQIKQLDQ